MKKFLALFGISCFFMLVPLVFWGGSTDRSRRSTKFSTSSCSDLLAGLHTNVPVLLIDTEILEAIQKNDCSGLDNERSVKIGVNLQYLGEKELLKDHRFDVIYFHNTSNKDYFDFRTEPRRIIPKNFTTNFVGKLEIPIDIPMFLGFWRRSRFLECMDLHIPRKGVKVNMAPIPSANQLALLRDELIAHGMFPALNGGSLLGWYRECSVIPHTQDMDFSIMAEDYRDGFLEAVEANSSVFRLSRKFGMRNDSFEMTVIPKEGFRVPIDIFLMYNEVINGTEISWVGGVDGYGGKYKFTYPKYDPWCSADLHGHIFWVTCSPRKNIVHEYGQLWYQDHLTSHYAWNHSGKNVQKNGNWTKEQMETVYKTYG